MPGVYWGFAFAYGSWLEVIEESITTGLLLFVYTRCLDGLESSVYMAPMAVGMHGLVDLLHHFELYPSEVHVKACCPRYPLFCGTIDLTFAAVLSLLIYCLGP